MRRALIGLLAIVLGAQACSTSWPEPARSGKTPHGTPPSASGAPAARSSAPSVAVATGGADIAPFVRGGRGSRVSAHDLARAMRTAAHEMTTYRLDMRWEDDQGPHHLVADVDRRTPGALELDHSIEGDDGYREITPGDGYHYRQTSPGFFLRRRVADDDAQMKRIKEYEDPLHETVFMADGMSGHVEYLGSTTDRQGHRFRYDAAANEPDAAPGVVLDFVVDDRVRIREVRVAKKGTRLQSVTWTHVGEDLDISLPPGSTYGDG